MQPSNPLNTKVGSFSRPPERPPVTPAPQPSVEAPKEPLNLQQAETAMAEQTQEERDIQDAAEREKAVKRIIESINKELEISLSTEDLKNYILKGRISKEVCIVNGVVKGTLQSLKIDDLQAIDIRMAQVRDKGQYTVKGLENEEAIIALSYAWTHADGKPLGDTPDKRETVIRKMGSLFIERASNARVSFDTLIRLAMQERGLVKK